VTVWHMRKALLDTKGYKHIKGYVILIAFPQQQYLQDGASVLLSYVHCLSSSHKSRYFPLCQ
jgi:hypothetical protein